MIIEKILDMFFICINTIVGFLPSQSLNNQLSTISSIGSLPEIMMYGTAFFPLSLWIAFIGNVVFWKGVSLTWAVIEWIYKKIPGVD